MESIIFGSIPFILVIGVVIIFALVLINMLLHIIILARNKQPSIEEVKILDEKNNSNDNVKEETKWE